jgi:DNA-binding helix-hairpin-helix protein with protein kinase domain
MISVEIRGIAPGCCTWCGKEKNEVVAFSFSDKSFSGSMCWNDLKRALKMKCPPSAPPVTANSDQKIAARA